MGHDDDPQLATAFPVASVKRVIRAPAGTEMRPMDKPPRGCDEKRAGVQPTRGGGVTGIAGTDGRVSIAFSNARSPRGAAGAAMPLARTARRDVPTTKPSVPSP